MDIEEVKDNIRKNVRFETVFPPNTKGGQTTGSVVSKDILISEELDLTFQLGTYKSKLKNRELLLTLFDLVLDETIK